MRLTAHHHHDYAHGQRRQRWWEVDLGSLQSIGQIALWFRRDCCYDRDGSLVISILSDPVNRTPVWMGAIGDPVPGTRQSRMTNLFVSTVVNGGGGRIVSSRTSCWSGQLTWISPKCRSSRRRSVSASCSRPRNVNVVTNDPRFPRRSPRAGPFTYQMEACRNQSAGRPTRRL